MNANIKKEEIVKFHQKKLERIPKLKSAMRDALASCATLLDVPPDEQITIVAFVAHHSWEDMTGIPTQLTFQASRKKLLEAQHGGPAALEAAVRVTEN